VLIMNYLISGSSGSKKKKYDVSHSSGTNDDVELSPNNNRTVTNTTATNTTDVSHSFHLITSSVTRVHPEDNQDNQTDATVEVAVP